MARNAPLAPGIPGFLTRPLVRCSLLMSCFSTLTRNLALFGSIHGRESAIFLGHVVPPPVRGSDPGFQVRGGNRLRQTASPASATEVPVRPGRRSEVIDLVRLTGVNRKLDFIGSTCRIAAVFYLMNPPASLLRAPTADVLPHLGKMLLSRSREQRCALRNRGVSPDYLGRKFMALRIRVVTRSAPMSSRTSNNPGLTARPVTATRVA